MKYTICIITYKRIEWLIFLLKKINEQKFNKISKPDFDCIVVDNDPDGSAESSMSSINNELNFDIRYFLEMRSGIPFARNRAVKEARTSDFIIFIDDDEYPSPQWLEELIITQQETDSDTVSGPVITKYIATPEKWVRDGKFLEREEHLKYKNRQIIPYRRLVTGNVIIRSAILKKLDFPFDIEMAETGGSDTDWAIRMYKIGAKMVWASNAIVYEWTPVDRVNESWIYQRAYRTANTEINFLYSESNGKRWLIKPKVFSVGILRIIYATFLYPYYFIKSTVNGKQFLIRHNRVFYRGMGMISSVFGYKYEEYKVRKEKA